MNYIFEEQRHTEIIGNFDVAVVGGGVAGISAALAASRNGAKTVLLEREFTLGGLGTLGLIAIYLPLCDGMGHQVSFGIAEELLKLSIKYGSENCNNAGEYRHPEVWINNGKYEDKLKFRYETQYNPSIFAIECEQLLLENGVKIMYGCQVCDTVLKNSRIETVILEEKGGRKAVCAKSFIDCTGDADVCKFSGVPIKVYEKKNALAAWYYGHTGNMFRLNMYGCADSVSVEQIKIIGNTKRYSGLDSESITEFMINAHASAKSHFLRNGQITPDYSMASIPTIPQLRMTRRIDGEYVMSETDEKKFFGDSVGMFADWRKAGPIYELPFRSLYSSKVKNLAVAGRCISSDDKMWDVTRVIPVCAVSGQAVGTASAISDDFTSINIELLQKKLITDGVKLHCGKSF